MNMLKHCQSFINNLVAIGVANLKFWKNYLVNIDLIRKTSHMVCILFALDLFWF